MFVSHPLSVFGLDCTLRGSPRSAFGRTATSITARWYVRVQVGTQRLYRFGACECVIPTSCAVLSVRLLWVCELQVVVEVDERVPSDLIVDGRESFCRGIPAALYNWLERYLFTNREAYLITSESIFGCRERSWSSGVRSLPSKLSLEYLAIRLCARHVFGISTILPRHVHTDSRLAPHSSRLLLAPSVIFFGEICSARVRPNSMPC